MRRNTKTRLAQWRHKAGLTLSEVSDLSGMSTAMWCLVENGKKNFSSRTKVAISRRLGVRIGELFEIVP